MRPLAGALAVVLVSAAAAAQGAEPARWLKGNLHTHSLWSDGNDFPERIARWYASHGYDFLALSDHNILSAVEKWIEVDLVVRRGGRTAFQDYVEEFGEDWVETRQKEEGKLEVRLKRLDEFRPLVEEGGAFLMIQGEEISASFDKLPIHINASNLVELVKPRGGDSVRDVIRNNLAAVREQRERTGTPIIAHLNHPNFGWAVTAEDLAHVIDERLFEVFNGHPGVRQLGDAQHAPIDRMWDIANTIRIAELGEPPLFGLATDDCHNYHNAAGSTPGRGWVMVRCGELEGGAIVSAIERGDFYASTGVTLREVAFAAGELRVAVEPRGDETYAIEFIGTLEGYDATAEPVVDEQGQPVRATLRYSDDVGAVLERVEGRAASYRLSGRELYVRARITSSAAPANPVWDDQRQQAWTQPVGWRARLR